MSLAVDEIVRVVADHRRKITGRDYSALVEQAPKMVGEKFSQEELCSQIGAWFRAFESEINPRWDGSIA